MATGALTLQDLFSVKYQAQSLLDFGTENMQKLIDADLTAHNTLVDGMFSGLAAITTERYTTYGGGLSGRKMRRVGEFGRTETQKPPVTSSNLGFPMWKFQHAVGWTNEFFENASVYDIAKVVQDAKDAHVLTLFDVMKWALYTPTNLTTYRDYHVDELSYTIRRLLNADGSGIPTTRNGKTFNGASHTHYLASSTLDNTAMKNLVNTVAEHEPGGELIVAINAADWDTVAGLADFKPFIDSRIVQPASSSDVYDGRLNATDMNNMAIGVFKAARVWVKPWAVQNYPLCYAPTAPQKPLALRKRDKTNLQGLRVVAQMREMPLYAEFMEDWFGMGALGREAAAVLYVGGASYVDPAVSIDMD